MQFERGITSQGSRSVLGAVGFAALCRHPGPVRGLHYAERQTRERETKEAQAWLLTTWGRPFRGGAGSEGGAAGPLARGPAQRKTYGASKNQNRRRA